MIDVFPVLIERRCGGWLAVSPPGVKPRIGVTALTREEAIAQWAISLARWRVILTTPTPTDAA